MIKTDGCGCSVVLFKDVLVRRTASTEDQRRQRRLDERQRLIAGLPRDIIWVGVDPGKMILYLLYGRMENDSMFPMAISIVSVNSRKELPI